jgi:hypothetical protein
VQHPGVAMNVCPDAQTSCVFQPLPPLCTATHVRRHARSNFTAWSSWDTNPLYALLHEPIYCQVRHLNSSTAAAASWLAWHRDCESLRLHWCAPPPDCLTA